MKKTKGLTIMNCTTIPKLSWDERLKFQLKLYLEIEQRLKTESFIMTIKQCFPAYKCRKHNSSDVSPISAKVKSP